MKKRIIAVLTALCLVLTCVPGIAGTAYADTDLPENQEMENSEAAPNKGYYPSAYPAGGIQDIRMMFPPTRNQGKYGSCWAHAAAACADLDMVKNHGQTAYTFNVSELQLAYYTYNTAIDRLGYLDGDVNKMASTAREHWLDNGGYSSRAMRTLSQWKGFTYEANIPYSSASSVLSYGLPSSDAYRNDAAKLEKAYFVNIKEDLDDVKQAIMQYGAVAISYEYEDAYYNGSTNSYRNPYDHSTDHSSTVVGWDDNYPASNFKYRPSRNGAWLVRNSWTTDNVASEDGYFWMSYEEASFADTACVMDFMPASRYDHNYQHDGTIFTGGIKAETAANVFTARNMNGAASETLEAVMISFDDEIGVRYQIDVYSGLTDWNNPESGYHHSYATTTGTLSHAGVFTVPLKQKVYLAPGETFSVVVTSLGDRRYFDSEKSRVYTYSDGTPRIETVAHADPQESFYKRYTSDKKWVDCATDAYPDYGNMCIKAITNDSSVKKYTVTYNLNGGTNNASNPAGFLSTQSGSFNLQNPTRSGYHFLGWYSDSSYTNKVTSIDYSKKANRTLYAKWCSDNGDLKTVIVSRATSSANGSYKVTCKECGKNLGTRTAYKINSVALKSKKLTYTGKNISPVPVIKDSKGNKLVNGKDYTYTYNKSKRKNVGRYYVTVKFKNRYNGSKKLYYTVAPKAPSSAGAKLYGYDDIKVSWSKCTGASGYNIYYKTSKAVKYTKYKSTTGRSLKFSNLSDNVKYNFKIVPYYKSGKTKYESVKYKVVSATTLKKLSQPKMERISGGRVSLRWESISGASGYQAYWARTKNGSYQKLCDYSSEYSRVTFTVGKGATFWYKTRAYKTVGNKKIYGPWSDPKKFIR